MTFSLPFCANSGQYASDPLLVVQPMARVGDRERHRRQPLGGRVDDDHRVALPGLARYLVPNTTPEIDDLLAAVEGAAGASQLGAPREILLECVADRLEAATDVSLNDVRCDGNHSASLVAKRWPQRTWVKLPDA